LRKRGVGFAACEKSEKVYYDLEFDADAIEASFAMQYGIRLTREDISFGEFLRLLSGVMPDTPLGRLVAVRSEKDAEVLKRFGRHEKKIRADWAVFCRGKNFEKQEFGDLSVLQGELARMFG